MQLQLSRSAVQRLRPSDSSQKAHGLRLLDWELRIVEAKLTHLQASHGRLIRAVVADPPVARRARKSSLSSRSRTMQRAWRAISR